MDWVTAMEQARARAKEESTGSQKFCDCCCGATPITQGRRQKFKRGVSASKMIIQLFIVC